MNQTDRMKLVKQILEEEEREREQTKTMLRYYNRETWEQ